MIKIEFFKDGICIQGHALASTHGSDIYCAGVSAISMGAINWFKPQDINFVTKDGYLKLKLLNVEPKNLELLKLLEIQLKSLNSQAYQEYLLFIDCKHKGV